MEQFSWTPLYTELATKLLDYKDNRSALVKWIYDDLGKVTRDDGKSLVAYLKMKDGSKIEDIDPFSVFGIFNRSTSWEKRTELLVKFKEFFHLQAEVPSDFNGIPTLDARRSFFFSWFDDNAKVISGIWELFEKIIKDGDIESAFNKVIENGMARYSLTMCLFWIAPQKFISLDSRNRSYLETYGFADEYPMLRYSDYMSLMSDIQKSMASGTIPASSFIEFSYMAWKASTQSPRIWMWSGNEETFSEASLKMGSSAKGLVSFASYGSKEELGKAYRAAVGNTDVKIPYAYWDFIRNVKEGDIVVVFSARKESGKKYHLLYGWGRFTSNCYYTTEENPLQRTVSWYLPYRDEPVIERKTQNDMFFHSVEGIEANNIIRLLNISEDAVLTSVETKRNYWLVGYSFSSTKSQLDRFIKDKIWEGGFVDDSPSDQKLLIEAKKIKPGDVLILKSTSTKGEKHNVPFLRVKAVAVVKGDIKVEKHPEYTSCSCQVEYYGIKDYDFDNPTLASYRKTLHLADAKAQPVIDYANSLLHPTSMPEQKYNEYIDLLLENHNLILTGAPGTGKTYMAKAIAKEMDAEWEFVQFHPSYDYTDFVEGLRPVGDSGNFGFELRNGVFKDFCARALQNLIDSKKSIQALEQESSVRERIDTYLDEVIESGKTFHTFGTKNVFHVVEYNEKTVTVEVPANEKTGSVRLPKSDLSALVEHNVEILSNKDIQNYFQRKHGTQQDAYIRVLYNRIKDYHPQAANINVSIVKLKKFVFIIDEINRGEISKIFGELFFSIDPGYRGEQGRVNTQYQNMIADDDIFKKGFFVPENVYIIGTMNDIDRSVESMDFAMRRRFAWREVTADDSMKMLDTMGNISSGELQSLKNRMYNLNKAITETDGLNEAYQIGGAYFLKYEKYHDFDMLWKNHLKGLLGEYLRGNRNSKGLLEDLYTAYCNDTIDEESADIEG